MNEGTLTIKAFQDTEPASGIYLYLETVGRYAYEFGEQCGYRVRTNVVVDDAAQEQIEELRTKAISAVLALLAAEANQKDKNLITECSR